MSTATITRTAASSTVTPRALPSDGVAVLVAAIDAVTTGHDTTASNAATLKRAVFDRFTFHAARAVEYHGVDSITPAIKSEIQGKVWRDATGDSKAVPAADRTKGQTSLGQYLSFYARVGASSVAALATYETAETAAAELDAKAKAQRDLDATRKANAAGAAFTAWLKAIPAADAAAIDRVFTLMAISTSAEHAPTFARCIAAFADVAEPAN